MRAGSGCTVAVLGAGPIGLLVLAAARHAGAAKIAVTDLLPGKRDRAGASVPTRPCPADATDLPERVQEALGVGQ
ncbi:hypothetical protein ACGFZQ_43620 [Streptomyces sp. NPDC048254]|uniref:hypothetical protein n=1 Tax=Streptomyces sp. NPDC048254 TaxID=3365525 RepID=UPI003714A1B3